MLILKNTGILKMLVIIANREDPEQSDLGLRCLSIGLFGRQLVFKILEHLPYQVKYEYRTYW